MIGKLRRKFNRKLKDRDFSEIFKKSVTGFLISVVGRLLGFGEQLIISNLYGAAALGVFRVCVSILSLVGIFGRFGVDAATARFIAQYRKQNDQEKMRALLRTGLRIVLRLAIILTVALVLIAPLLSNYIYHKPYTLHIQIIAAGLIFFVLSGVIEEGLRGLKKIKQYAWINNVSTQALVIVLLLLGLLLPDKTYAVNISYVIGLGFTFCLGFYYLKKYIPSDKTSLTEFPRKELLDVSLPLLSAKYLTTLYTLLATPILAIYVTDADVGVFSGAARLTAFATMPLIAVNNISGPRFAEAFGTNDNKQIKKTVSLSTRLIFWSCMPIMIVFFLIPKFLLSFWGEEFTTSEAIITFHIINAGQVVNFMTGPVTQLLNMTGHQRVTQRYAAITTFTSIALSFVFIPEWGLGLGIMGAALATSIGRTILNLGCAVHIYSTMGVSTVYNPFTDLIKLFQKKARRKQNKLPKSGDSEIE